MFPVFSWYADYVDEVSKPWVIPDPDPREVTFGKYTVHYAYSYYGQVKSLVKQWKFQGDHALGFRLGELMGITYNHLLCGNVVSYVPRYGESYPYFGNHLFSFLAGLQKTGNCAVVPAYVKTRSTMPQKTLSRSARMVNLHDAFVPKGTCADIVVDDVLTTGATSRVLYKCSPFKVWLVLARVELDLSSDFRKA